MQRAQLPQSRDNGVSRSSQTALIVGRHGTDAVLAATSSALERFDIGSAGPSRLVIEIFILAASLE